MNEMYKFQYSILINRFRQLDLLILTGPLTRVQRNRNSSNPSKLLLTGTQIMDPLPVHGGTSQRPLLIRRSEKVVKERFHRLLPGCESMTTVSNCDSNFFR